MQTPSYPRELTLIPRPPEQVIGRAKQLETIHKNLDNYKAPIVLVNGIGGIGKTTVALEFIQQHGAAYPHLAWIEVTDTIPAAMVANKTLLKNLHLEAELETLPPDTYEAQAFDLILNKLNRLPACLLVIDNANNLDDLLRCEQRLRSLNAKTLLTSRALPENWATVKINELNPGKAAILFMTHYIKEIQDAQLPLVYQLLQCLDHHTLLIELIAKAAYKANLSLETLYEKVQNSYLRDADLNARRVATGTHANHTKLPQQERVENYITLVFQQISTLSDPEQRYLRYMTLLPSNDYKESFLLEIFTYQPENAQPTQPSKPKTLWQRLFQKAPKKSEPIAIEPKEHDSTLITDTLEALAQKGWLSQKRDTQGCTYKLHSLIQNVAIQELGVSYAQCAPVLDYWIAALDIDQAKDNPIEKFPLLSYGEFLIEKLQAEKHEQISELLDKLGWIKYDLGQFKEAAIFREKALEIAIAILGKTHSIVSTRQSNLGIVYRQLGQYERARDLLEKALASAIENFGEKHPQVAIYQSNLANVYGDLGQYEQARDLLEKALASDIKNFEEKHPNVATSQSNLANVYYNLGQNERARDLLEKALASAIENFGEKHPKVAVSQSNLANVYYHLGQYERARDLLEKALASDMENFGEKHPNVAVRQSNLALVYRNLGQYERARDLLEKALASDMENFGEKHPQVAIYQSNLANVYGDLGQYERARDLLEQTLASDIENFGEKHPNIATDYNNLAWVYINQKDWATAKINFLKALEICNATWGEQHPNTKTTIESLAYVEAQLGESSEL